MSSIEVILPDHDEVLTRLTSSIERTPEQLDEVLQNSATLLEGYLKTDFQTRTHGSGLTAASIENKKEGLLTYGVGSYTRGNILRFLDKGTGIYGGRGTPILIEPLTKLALRFWNKETGEKVFAQYCIVMGIIPYGFFDRLESHLSEIDKIMKEKVKI